MTETRIGQPLASVLPENLMHKKGVSPFFGTMSPQRKYYPQKRIVFHETDEANVRDTKVSRPMLAASGDRKSRDPAGSLRR